MTQRADVDGELERVLAGRQGRKVGDEIKFLCPAHDDSNPSAEWNRRKSAWNCPACGAGGSSRELAERLGIEVESPAQRAEQAQIVATYDYTDEQGNLLYQVVRLQPKDFRQRRPDGQGGWIWKKHDRQVLYRLHRLQGRSGRLYWPEGEKDVDNLERLGALATTSAGGAVGRKKATDPPPRQKWYPEYGGMVRGFQVVLVRDNDQAGADYCADFAIRLSTLGNVVRILDLPGLPPKGDVSDWLAAGGTLEELDRLADEAPIWQPPAEVTGVNAFAETDAGNAELFAHLLGERVRYDHRRQCWLIWDRHRWLPDDRAEIMLLAKEVARTRKKAAADLSGDQYARAAKWAHSCESAARMEAMLKLSRSEPPIGDAGKGWDSNPLLIGVVNGAVNLATGQLRDGRREDRVTMSTGIVFDPGASCVRWEQFLGEVFDSKTDMIRFIQRAVGYSLSGSMREQVWFLAQGKGSNGKSVFLSVLRAVAGDYSTNMASDTVKRRNGGSSGPTSDLARLASRRLVTCSELAEASSLDEERLKGLTHGDRVTARFQHAHEFEFNSEMKLWIATNHLPQVKDATDGFWRGVRVLPFNRQFGPADADPDLEAKLMAELPGILNWAIAGAMDWHKHGLGRPQDVMLATLAYREQSDPLAEFIADRCITGEQVRATSGQLYEAYRAWGKAQGYTEKDYLGARTFTTRLAERFPRVPSHGIKWYRGIGLRSDDSPTVEAPDESTGASTNRDPGFSFSAKSPREKTSDQGHLRHPRHPGENSPEECDCDDPRHLECPLYWTGPEEAHCADHHAGLPVYDPSQGGMN